MSEHDAGFSGHAILELMGHRRLGGYVTEQTIAGAGFLRIDCPETEGYPATTQFYAPSAVYCLTPSSEEAALAALRQSRPSPFMRLALPTGHDDELDEYDLD